VTAGLPCRLPQPWRRHWRQSVTNCASYGAEVINTSTSPIQQGGPQAQPIAPWADLPPAMMAIDQPGWKRSACLTTGASGFYWLERLDW